MLNEVIFSAIICMLLIYIHTEINAICLLFLRAMEIGFVNPQLSYVFWSCCLLKTSLS